MTDAALPPDPRDWPTDPYELLGIPQEAMPRDLKRAYARLIRQFKPEHAPDEFRRVREAYEQVLARIEHLAFFERLRMGPVEAEEPSAGDAPSADGGTRAPRAARSATQTLDEELEILWQRVCKGEEAPVYAALRELERRQPGQAQICLRLYWLLDLAPELDPQHDPCHWLVQGLRSSDLSGPLAELYRRELRANPIEAASARCRQLLDHPTIRGGARIDLLQWRWQATSRSPGALDLVATDLEQLRPALAPRQDEDWARVLLLACDHLAWSDRPDDSRLFEDCRRQLDDMHHLHQQLAAGLDRLDLLVELSAGWKLLDSWHDERLKILELIPISWTQSVEQLRPALLRCMAEAVRFPWELVEWLDRAQRSASTVVLHYGRMLGWLEDAMEPAMETRPVELVGPAIQDFVQSSFGQQYTDWRRSVLNFCLRENVTPQAMAGVLTGDNGYALADVTMADALESDYSLAVVTQMHRLFWQ